MKPRTSSPAAVIGGAFVILFSALFLSGCSYAAGGSTTADSEAACSQAFAQAMAIDPASDTVGGLDGTIASCSSLEAWVSAASEYPDTTAGQDPQTYALTRCAATPAIANSPVCIALPAQPTASPTSS